MEISPDPEPIGDSVRKVIRWVGRGGGEDLSDKNDPLFRTVRSPSPRPAASGPQNRAAARGLLDPILQASRLLSPVTKNVEAMLELRIIRHIR